MYKGIKNALINSGSVIPDRSNAPYRDDTAPRMYTTNTKIFYARNLRFSGNMVWANVQGMDYRNFYEYRRMKIRVSDMVTTSTGKNLGSDWKRIMPEDTRFEFFPVGAKVCFNGQVYLVVNPTNVATVHGTAVIRRCNATWNHMDAYGKVLHEPFIYGDGNNDMATGDDAEYHMILVNGYQHAIMQLNPETSCLEHNTRILLGRSCYTVRGLQDFAQEFSEEQDSVHIQYFDLHKSDPIEALDDLENRVADRKGLRWVINVDGPERLTQGVTAQLKAVSLKNDEVTTLTCTYRWESMDTDVLTVDADGNVTAVSAGTGRVKCVLNENEEWETVFPIEVEEAVNGLVWTDWQDTLGRFQTCFVKCVEETDEGTKDVVYQVKGPGKDYFSFEEKDGGLEIKAWLTSDEPVRITAKAGDGTESTREIRLKGW